MTRHQTEPTVESTTFDTEAAAGAIVLVSVAAIVLLLWRANSELRGLRREVKLARTKQRAEPMLELEEEVDPDG